MARELYVWRDSYDKDRLCVGVSDGDPHRDMECLFQVLEVDFFKLCDQELKQYIRRELTTRGPVEITGKFSLAIAAEVPPY